MGTTIAPPSGRHATRDGRVAIVLGAVAWSTAGLAQRELTATPATQVAGRALFACATLLVAVLVSERRGVLEAMRSLGWDGAVITVFLAVSSGTFLLALNSTSVANVLFLQAAAPVAAALLGWLVLHEPVSGRTWAAMLLAAVGVAVMVAGSLDAGIAAVVLPIVMTASFAIVIVMARYRRDVSMLPASCLSQALVVAVVAPFASFGSATAADWRIFLALGVFQIGLGLGLLTVGARLLPPAEVALLSMLELVLGPLWVWLAYGEKPAGSTLVGGAVVAVAIAVQATGPEGPTGVGEGIALQPADPAESAEPSPCGTTLSRRPA